jgi:glycosyltransferase involved in cell wall biosynthesis
MPVPDVIPAAATSWPRITVVTACANAARWLEMTIRSVLLQGYPNLEYLVLDNASQDGTAAILDRYAPWLSRCVREPDLGQSDALAKGFALATGDLVAWINADDYYLPGALHQAAMAYVTSPSRFVAGAVRHLDDASGRSWTVTQEGLRFADVVRFWTARSSFQQPGCFWPRRVFEEAGGLDPALNYAMDLDLLCRVLHRGVEPAYVSEPLACYREHEATKTRQRRLEHVREISLVSRRFWTEIDGVDRSAHDRFVAGVALAAAWSDGRRGRPLRAVRSLAWALLHYPRGSSSFVAARFRRRLG